MPTSSDSLLFNKASSDSSTLSSRIILVLGAPGSGKGTQVSLLRTAFPESMTVIGAGQLLREQIQAQTPVGKKIQFWIESGDMAPDYLVLFSVAAEIERLVYEKKPLIFVDGFPRSLCQAYGLKNLLKILRLPQAQVVVFSAPMDALVERIAIRETCSDCGSPYGTRKPKVAGTCDDCGGKQLIQRKEDDPKIALRRLQIHADMEKDLLAFYEKDHVIHYLDARESIEIIHQKMQEICGFRRDFI